MTRVAVLGALGRMGGLTAETVADSDDLGLVACVDPTSEGEIVAGVPVQREREALVAAGADVAVDFTHPDSAQANIDFCLDHSVHVVVGTSGFTRDRLDALAARLSELGPDAPNAIVVPNFAIGAVLMMHFAEMAVKHMDRAEIIEMHHDGKADAPSGTAINTGERLQAARASVGGWPERGDSEELISGARGGHTGDVRIHSIRLPGLVAHQEVLLGAQGQTLSIRHDTVDRSAFMPGVLLAVREVAQRRGLTVGLEPLLGL